LGAENITNNKNNQNNKLKNAPPKSNIEFITYLNNLKNASFIGGFFCAQFNTLA
jgi:hypothetical protein